MQSRAIFENQICYWEKLENWLETRLGMVRTTVFSPCSRPRQLIPTTLSPHAAKRIKPTKAASIKGNPHTTKSRSG